mgnify:CR=1 FL=1
MRVLISGGFGFVGGRLAQHLHKAGHLITLGSRRACSPPDWLPEAEVVKLNWNDFGSLFNASAGADLIIHSAGMNAQDCSADPSEALAFNGVATARFVDAACKARVKRFIYLSTAHVYGSPLTGTITEDTCPRNLHPYATSHLAGENVVLYANSCKQIEGIVMRLSNVFGAPAHPSVNCWMLLIQDLCRQAVVTGRIVLNSSGLQLRDFIPMKRVCEIFQELSTVDIAWSFDTPINLGSSNSVSVRFIAELVQARCLYLLGRSPTIHIPPSASIIKTLPFEFSTHKLAQLCLPSNIDMESEIDSLLRFCIRYFSRFSSG